MQGDAHHRPGHGPAASDGLAAAEHARREAASARRFDALEQHLRLAPDTADMAGLHSELAALRGEMQALNARISGLDRLLERLEHTFDRHEDRQNHTPHAGGQYGCRAGVDATGGCN